MENPANYPELCNWVSKKTRIRFDTDEKVDEKVQEKLASHSDETLYFRKETRSVEFSERTEIEAG